MILNTLINLSKILYKPKTNFANSKKTVPDWFGFRFLSQIFSESLVLNSWGSGCIVFSRWAAEAAAALWLDNIDYLNNLNPELLTDEAVDEKTDWGIQSHEEAGDVAQDDWPVKQDHKTF